MRTRTALPFLLVLASMASSSLVAAQTTGTTTGSTVGNIIVSLNYIAAPAPDHDRGTDGIVDLNRGINVYDCAQKNDVNITLRLQTTAGFALAGRQYDIWLAPQSSGCQNQSARTLQNNACRYITHASAAGTNGADIVLPLSAFVGDPGSTAPITCDPNAPPNASGASSYGIWVLMTDQAEDRGSNVTNFGLINMGGLRMDFARPFAPIPKVQTVSGNTSVPISWSQGATADAEQLQFLVLVRTGGCDLGISDAGVPGSDASIDAGVDASDDGGVEAGVDGGVDASVDGGAEAGVDAGVDASVDGGTGSVDLTPGGYLPTTYAAAPAGWTPLPITNQGIYNLTLNPEALGLTLGDPSVDGSTPPASSTATVLIVPQDQALNTGAISTAICVQRVPTYGLCELLAADGKSCPSGACAASPIGDHRRGSLLALFLVSLVALVALARRLRRST